MNEQGGSSFGLHCRLSPSGLGSEGENSLQSILGKEFLTKEKGNLFLQVLQHFLYEMTVSPDCQRVLWVCRALASTSPNGSDRTRDTDTCKQIHVCVEGINRMAWNNMQNINMNSSSTIKNVHTQLHTYIYTYTHISTYYCAAAGHRAS